MRIRKIFNYSKTTTAVLLVLVGTISLLAAGSYTTRTRASVRDSRGTTFKSFISELPFLRFLDGPTVTTDKADYPIGATVVIAGSGWQPGETVTLQVTDDLSVNDPNHEAHAPWDVVADADGNISSTWTVDADADTLTLTLTATGHSSGATATTTFTDANPSASLDQCANDPAPSPSTDGCATSSSDWDNGNLGASKSVYFEGDSIPYRLILENLPTGAGNPHTVTIEWDTTKGDKHAIDYLTSFDRTVGTANPCLGVPVAHGDPPCGPLQTYGIATAIPADPQVTGAGVTPVAGNFSMFGGTITAVSTYTYADGSGFTGDKSARITITFTANQSNPVLAWGGHIATRTDWGLGGSAVSISGSPYHTRLIDLDGSGGNQDRSLSAEAVIFPGSITIIKDAQPDTSTSFSYTASPSPLSNFSLVDDGTHPLLKTKLFDNITTFQTYTIAEGASTTWPFLSVSCSVTSPNGGSSSTNSSTATINMKEGENWTCTYINKEDENVTHGKINVIKVTEPSPDPTDSSFQIAPSYPGGSFFLKNGENKLSDPLVPGNGFSLSETSIPAGWELKSVACTLQGGGSTGTATGTGITGITVEANKTTTCTFTNGLQPKLTVIKHVLNDNGGTKTAADFSLHVKSGSSDVSNSPAAGSESGTTYTLSPGTFVVSENTPPTGYLQTGISGNCTSNGSVTLAYGDNKTCTVTNDDQAAHLIVIKHVVNDNGGTKVASNFTTTISGVNTANPSAPGAESPGVNNTLTTVGSYSVDEGAHVGYDESLSADCSGTIALGETKTCTITNDDQAAHLIVIKHVTNDNGGAKVAADFTTIITGVTTANPSAPGAESPGVNNTLTTVGSYSVDEGAHDGYDKSLSADCSGTIALGETKTCTITNNDQAAHLIVIKHVINDNGGIKVAADFTTTISGVTTANPIAAGAESPGVNNTLTTVGSYSVDEGAHVGYDKSLSADCSGTIALGQTKTCTITNDDQQPHLIVIKHVLNNNGGTAVASDFAIAINQGQPPVVVASFQGVESPGTNVGVSVGAYDVGEIVHPDYQQSYSADCTGTIALGETKTCTITNDDKPAHLIVIKHVANDNGGGKVAADFTTTITGVTTANASAPGAEAPGVDNTLTSIGSYSVDEGDHTGYDRSLSAGCSGTIALGETKTCTITNDDQAAHLIVIKHVINNNGGSKVAADFTTTITGVSTVNPSAAGAESPGVDNVLTSVGSYSVDEGAHVGYDRTLDAGCSGTIALGQTKTCTITNDDQAAHLIVIKHVINDNGGGKVAGDFTTTISGVTTATPSAAGVESPGVNNTLTSVGSYSVDEGVHDGYDKTLSSYCSGTIALGQTKTCTITNNDQPGTLIVKKIVINDNGDTKVATDFSFKVNAGSAVVFSQDSDSLHGKNVLTVNASTYSVTEANTPIYGYDTAYDNCTNVVVPNGGSQTCTITNDDKPGTIVIVKNAKPATGTFSFDTTGSTAGPGTSWPGGFPLTGSTSSGGNTRSFTVDKGLYSVHEGMQLSWVLTGIGGGTPIDLDSFNCVVSGSGGSSGVGKLSTAKVNISIFNGDMVTCTFENTGNGATRTQGFWATHPQLAQIAWFGGTAFGHTFPGVANVSGIGDRMLCGRAIDGPGPNMPGDISKLMGGFWSGISSTSTNKKRSSLDQARMQLLQQLLAGELNASAFGSAPGSGTFGSWESAYCGTNQNAISTAQQQAGSFNSSGDSSTFTPGTSADSKNARAVANYAFWDTLP